MSTSARATPRALRTLLVVAVLAALTGCGSAGPPDGEALAPTTDRPVGRWVQVSPSPLGARTGSSGVWTGEELLVAGGRTGRPCPPGADCAGDTGVLLADAAAYDPAVDEWRAVARAPVPFADGRAAWVDDEMVVLSGSTALAYAPSDDTWRRLPSPPRPLLVDGEDMPPPVVVDGRVVLTSYSTPAGGARLDLVLDVDRGTWTSLPADPFGESYDRSLTWDGERLWLLSMAAEQHFEAYDGAASRLAVLEGGLTDGTWRVVDDTTPPLTYGQRAWWTDGRLVVPPGAGQPARVYAPDTRRWSEVRADSVEGCALPPLGVGATWVGGGGTWLVAGDGQGATAVPPCPSVPEPAVAVWADDLVLLWGGPAEGYDANTADGLAWRAPA